MIFKREKRVYRGPADQLNAHLLMERERYGMAKFPKTREEMVAQGYSKIGEKICDAQACGARLEMWRTPKDHVMPMNADGEFVTHFATCPEREKFQRR